MTPPRRQSRPPQAGGALDLTGVLQFMQTLWALVHGLERRSKRMARTIGVTGSQRLVLRVVGLSPGISPGSLAAVLHVDPSTLTGVLRRLVSQRLLRRTRDRHDRRRATLRLSSQGERINRPATGTVECAIGGALRSVTPRDRATTQRVLEGLAARLLES